MKFTDRLRRPRIDGIRPLVSETTLDAADPVAPAFVGAMTDERAPIGPIPGHECVSIVEAVDRIAEVREAGAKAVITFGTPGSKNPEGSRAYARNGVIQEIIRTITAEMDAYVIADVCSCECTDRGHCGVLEGHAENDPIPAVEDGPTLDLLVGTAVSYAEAGVDTIVLPASVDGMVGAICTALDDVGHDEIPVMSYTVKYENAFYGPFRDVTGGALAFGDRRRYQMDPASVREAPHEITFSIEQGADVLMVKPGLPYLDIVRAIREGYDYPVTACSVSGEYAIFHTAAEKGWLDLDGVTHESPLSMKRTGADLTIAYFAECVARQLD